MKEAVFIRLIAAAFVLLAFVCEVAHSTTVVQTARFSNYSVDDGLSQSSVTAILQDTQGYLWIGTEDGLNRFDGYEFLRFGYSSDGRAALAGGGVSSLLEGRDGRIWIGTYASGLYWIDPVSGFVTHCDLGANTDAPDTAGRIRDLSIDHDGTIWVLGTPNLYRQVEDCDFEIVALGQEARDKRLTGISNTADGAVWLWASSGELWRNRGAARGFTLVRTSAGLRSGAVQVQAVAGTGEDTWVGFDSADLIRLDADGNVLEHIEIPAALSAEARIRSIYTSAEGQVWVAGLGIGIAQVVPGSGVTAVWHSDTADPASIAHDDTSTLLADRSGGLWVGTRSHGLSRLQIVPEGIAHYRHSANDPTSITNNMVTSFAERSQDERIWVGSDGGGLDLVELGVGVVAHYQNDPANADSLNSDRVWALHEDRTGRLWIGTWFGGLSMLAPGSSEFVRHLFSGEAEDLARSVVLSIEETADGTVWFGTMFDGLFSLPPGTAEVEGLKSDSSTAGLSSQEISDLFVDSRDRLWVGTWDAGINMVDRVTGEITQFRKTPGKTGGLPHDTVRAISESANGSIWVGTSNGLARIDPGTAQVSSFGIESGLPPGTIYGVVVDGDSLWVSSNRGIARFSPSTRSAQQFDPADGLQGFEFNGGAYLRTRDGRVLFGGTQGFNAFYPEQVQNNPYPPQVAITQVTVQDRVYNRTSSPVSQPGEAAQFAHDQNRLTFEFSGLHYSSPQRTQYAFRLQGLQDEWIATSASQRVATYANLSPGDYRFQVRAASNNGLWSEEDASFEFAIAAPWWVSGPAYLVYVLLLALAIFGFVQWRTVFLRRRAALLKTRVREGTRRIAEQKQTIEKQAGNLQALLETKERLFARVSHEFRTPLTLILGPLDRLRANAGESDAETLSLIQRNAKRLLRLVEQLLDLARLSGERPLQLEAIALEPFLSALVGAYRSLAEQRGISLALTIASRSTVDANIEVLEAALSNLIGNALKFTPAGGRVEVSLVEKDGMAMLRVSDSGPGIQPGKEEQIFEPFERDSSLPGTGIGLAVVRESVKSLGGDVHVGIAEIGGAEFTITLPISKTEVVPQAVQPTGERSLEVPQTENAEMVDSLPETGDDDGRPHILVIEDHDDLRAYIGESLDSDFHCTLAADGEAGVEHAIRDIPDLVLSDVMLPGIDGFEVTHRLRHDERTSHIPIVLLTAREDRESLLRGLSEKADEYLTKPFDAEELKLRLHNLIEVRQIMRRQAAAKRDRGKSGDDATASTLEIHGPKDQAFLDKLDGLLADQYADNAFTVKEMASGMAMSDRQLLRKLRALLDTRPTDYLRDYRLQQAALLLDSGKPIGVIAQDCGFATQAHFGQCFKARFGVTPSEFATGSNPD